MFQSRRSKRTKSPSKQERNDEQLSSNNNDSSSKGTGDRTKKKKKGKLRSKLIAFRAATLQTKLLRRHKRLTETTQDQGGGSATRTAAAETADEAMSTLLSQSQKRNREMDSSLGSAFRSYVSTTSANNTKSKSYESRYPSSPNNNKNNKTKRTFSPTFGQKRIPKKEPNDFNLDDDKDDSHETNKNDADDGIKDGGNENKSSSPRRRRSKRNRNPILSVMKHKSKQKATTTTTITSTNSRDKKKAASQQQQNDTKNPIAPPSTTSTARAFFDTYWNPTKQQGGGEMSKIEEESDTETINHVNVVDGEPNSVEESNDAKQQEQQQKEQSASAPPSLVVVDPFRIETPQKDFISPLDTSPRKSQRKKRIRLSETGFPLESLTYQYDNIEINKEKNHHHRHHEQPKSPKARRKVRNTTATAFGSDEELSVTTTTSDLLQDVSCLTIIDQHSQQQHEASSSVETTTQKNMYLSDKRMQPILVIGTIGIAAGISTLILECYTLFFVGGNTTTIMERLFPSTIMQLIRGLVVVVATILCCMMGILLLFQRKYLLELSNQELIHEDLLQQREDLEYSNTHLRSRQIGATAAMERYSRDILMNHSSAAKGGTAMNNVYNANTGSNRSVASTRSSGSGSSPTKTRTTASISTVADDHHHDNTNLIGQVDVSRLVAVWHEQRSIKHKIRNEQKKLAMVALTRALLISNRRHNPNRQNSSNRGITAATAANNNTDSAGPSLNQIGITLMKSRLPPGVTLDEAQLHQLLQSKGPKQSVFELYRMLVATSEDEDETPPQEYEVFQFESPVLKE